MGNHQNTYKISNKRVRQKPIIAIIALEFPWDYNWLINQK